MHIYMCVCMCKSVYIMYVQICTHACPQLVFFIQGICISEFASSLKPICNPQVNTQISFTVICRHAHNGENVSCLTCTFPAEAQQGDPAFLFWLSYCKQTSFWWHLVPKYLHFCASGWQFCCLKWPKSVMPKCCLSVPKCRRLCCSFQRKCVCWGSILQA